MKGEIKEIDSYRLVVFVQSQPFPRFKSGSRFENKIPAQTVSTGPSSKKGYSFELKGTMVWIIRVSNIVKGN